MEHTKTISTLDLKETTADYPAPLFLMVAGQPEEIVYINWYIDTGGALTNQIIIETDGNEGRLYGPADHITIRWYTSDDDTPAPAPADDDDDDSDGITQWDVFKASRAADLFNSGHLPDAQMLCEDDVWLPIVHAEHDVDYIHFALGTDKPYYKTSRRLGERVEIKWEDASLADPLMDDDDDEQPPAPTRRYQSYTLESDSNMDAEIAERINAGWKIEHEQLIHDDGLLWRMVRFGRWIEVSPDDDQPHTEVPF